MRPSGKSLPQKVTDVKKRPWHKIIAVVALSTIVIGIAPLGYLSWWGQVHNLEPLSMPLPLKRGEYVSPYFKTDLDDTYQVDLAWDRFSPEQTATDLDWRIVDEKGTVIEQGAYNDRLSGSAIGNYRPRRGLRQRIIVNVHQDVHGAVGQPMLEIGLPEVGLDMAEGAYPLAMLFAVTLSGSGAMTFLILMVIRTFRRQRSRLTAYEASSKTQ